MQLLASRKVIVDPALGDSERLVWWGLEEVNPDVTGAEFERDTKSSGGLLGVPDMSAGTLGRYWHGSSPVMPVLGDCLHWRVVRMPPTPVEQTWRERIDQIARADAERLNFSELLHVVRKIVQAHIRDPHPVVEELEGGSGRVAISWILAWYALSQTDTAEKGRSAG